MKPAVELGDYAVSERTTVLCLMLAFFMFVVLVIFAALTLSEVKETNDKVDRLEETR